MVASSTGWAWLLELILNLISSQGLLKSKTTTSNDWALLPELVLNLILHKLQELPDCVRFASVCTTRRIAAKNSGNKQFPVPVLLIPKTSNRNKIAKTLLFSVQENKTYNVQIRIDESTFRFCGSSHGWICAVESDFSITLSSPTTKNPQSATVRLPPITSIDDQCLGLTSGLQEGIQGSRHYIPQFCIRKVTLSADPTATRDYFVVAIYGFRRQLAILRSGDGSWTYLDRSLGLFSDATWHKNKLYAVNQLGELMQIDGVNSRNLSPSMVYSTNYNPQKNITRFYLVESSRGELLLVERYIDPTMQDQNGRNSFKVHRLEMSLTEEKKIRHRKMWAVLEFLLMRVSEKANRVEVKEIGGDALFIGDNYSAAVAASKMCQCRQNCIYYTEDSMADVMGIFCLENGKSETRHSLNPPQRILHPIWFTPILSDWI